MNKIKKGAAPILKSGKEWFDFLSLPFSYLNYSGFGSYNNFLNEVITREEFFLRSSNCSISHKNSDSSRRSIKEFKHILLKN